MGFVIGSGVVQDILPIFRDIVLILIGAGVTYFVTTRNQRRIWKREYAIRVVEEVYGKVYDNIKSVLKNFQEKAFQNLPYYEWGTIQESYRYFMVDEAFRKKLDEFSKRMSNYSHVLSEVFGDIVKTIALEEAEKTYGLRLERQPVLKLKWEEGPNKLAATVSDFIIVNSMLLQKNPINFYFEHVNAEVPKGIELEVEPSGTVTVVSGSKYNINVLKERFDSYWKSCLERMKNEPKVKFIIKEKEELVVETRNVMGQLENYIQKPWQI